MSVNGDTMIWHCIILLPNCNIFFTNLNIHPENDTIKNVPTREACVMDKADCTQQLVRLLSGISALARDL